MNEIFIQAKKAARSLVTSDGNKRNEVLLRLASLLRENSERVLAANALDLEKMDRSNPLYDRLLLNATRIDGIASDTAAVASLPDPVGRLISSTVRPNGLRIKRVSVPFGVVGVIFESRPNVAYDVFSLCFKSGNACILKGSKDAENSNIVALELMRHALSDCGFDPCCVSLMPSTHEAVGELFGAVGMVDLVIPRGGRRLIDFVRDNSRVPCIETGAGVVHAYFDESADLEMGRGIDTNAKTRRVSVCNALDCLIVNEKRLADLPALLEGVRAKEVELFCDYQAFSALEGKYPSHLLHTADEQSFGTEFMALKMAVKTVPGIQEALDHIARFGSGHSESIITSDENSARRFRAEVDAACVYVNAPTSFSDGAQFGLGAEIGISTQKLGPRGPMGLEELTTYKWLIDGEGQLRP
ncbi:MAG: glutamate-5-semialdehyde dehydrogenase [Bacteroidales bacterium]|nr:glutamate-5-semialdehyde dehydrogenase [Bacteroidales bacterium]